MEVKVRAAKMGFPVATAEAAAAIIGNPEAKVSTADAIVKEVVALLDTARRLQAISYKTQKTSSGITVQATDLTAAGKDLTCDYQMEVPASDSAAAAALDKAEEKTTSPAAKEKFAAGISKAMTEGDAAAAVKAAFVAANIPPEDQIVSVNASDLVVSVAAVETKTKTVTTTAAAGSGGGSDSGSTTAGLGAAVIVGMVTMVMAL